MNTEAHPFADATTRRVLGIDAYLDRLQTDSNAGHRRRSNQPWFGPENLDDRRATIDRRRRLDRWIDSHPKGHDSARNALSNLPTLDDIDSCVRNDPPLGEGLLFELKQFLHYAEQLITTIGAPLESWSIDTNSAVERLRDLQATIHPDGVGEPNFRLADELDDTLAQARHRRDDARAERDEHRRTLEQSIRDDHGGSFGFDGTFRPPRDTDRDALRQDDRLLQAGTTDAPRWRLDDDRLDDLQRALDDAQSAFDDETRRVCRSLTEQIADEIDWLVSLEPRLAAVDLALATCRLRRRLEGCWGDAETPGRSVDRTTHTRIERGQEPALADQLGDDLQPIDIELDGPTCVITGPNMGGKSRALILIGLCQWCAQHALPIPADQFDFKPVRHLVYIGSEQPQQPDDFDASGLSAFAREIRRVVDWLDAPAPATWLLDEVARGTHPGDGADLLIDLLENLADDGHRTVASSHFPALAELDGVQHLQIRGLPDDLELTSILDATAGVEGALLDVIDHQPEDVATGSVPRDARRVANALGLSKLSRPMPSDTSDASTPRSFDTKPSARDWVWTELRERGAARFPFPIRDRIPNFEGAADAARRLFDETDLADASAIKVNPDSPQKHVRRMALEHGVAVFVPTPRLKGGFMKFDPDAIDPADYEDASMLSRWDAHKREVPLDELPQLDAIVTGCVAVTASGKRCGKGEGFSDLEYAILRELGHDPVPVYTTVHSLQVVDAFPTESHDLSLAGIATPEDWLHVSDSPTGPDAIHWERLSDEDLDAMPILEQLQST